MQNHKCQLEMMEHKIEKFRNGNEARRGRKSVQNIKDEHKNDFSGWRGLIPSWTQNRSAASHNEEMTDTLIHYPDQHVPGVHPLLGGLPVEEGNVSSEGWESWEAEAARPPSESRCVLATTGLARGSKGCNSCWTRRFLAKWWL